jgi:N-methylhydantoinase A
MVHFDEVEEGVETPIYSHDGLPAGAVIEGPAIVEQLDSTTVVPPGVRAEVDEWLNIRIHVAEAKT